MNKLYTRQFAIIAIVAMIAALAAAMYLTGDTAQRAARYYDPANHTLYIRIVSAVVRTAGSYGIAATFAVFSVAGVLLGMLTVQLLSRLLRWLEWPDRHSALRS